ncbi:hypothetical protein [Sporocytophaga myxococcoides]|nr:hypothetical protein [Sporocytophaga myxococcoides]
MNSNSPIYEGDIVVNMVPQKEPFVMVDKLLYSDDAKTISGLTIKEDNIFSYNGYFREPGLVENMAQTAALRMGYEINRQKSDINGDLKGAPVGYIGAIKGLKIHSLPPIQSELITEVRFENEVMGVLLIKAFCTCNGNAVAECEMKIFVKKD